MGKPPPAQKASVGVTERSLPKKGYFLTAQGDGTGVYGPGDGGIQFGGPNPIYGPENSGGWLDVTAIGPPSPLYAGGINLRDKSGGGLNLLSSIGILIHDGDVDAAVVYPGGAGTPIILATDFLGTGTGEPAVVVGIYPGNQFRVFDRGVAGVDTMFSVQDYQCFARAILDLNDGHGLSIDAWSGDGLFISAEVGGGVNVTATDGGVSLESSGTGSNMTLLVTDGGGMFLTSNGGGGTTVRDDGGGIGLIETNAGGIVVQERDGGSVEVSTGSTTPGTGAIRIKDYGGGGISLESVSGYLTLVGLPTAAPGGTNRVWRDALGYVRIT